MRTKVRKISKVNHPHKSRVLARKSRLNLNFRKRVVYLADYFSWKNIALFLIGLVAGLLINYNHYIVPDQNPHPSIKIPPKLSSLAQVSFQPQNVLNTVYVPTASKTPVQAPQGVINCGDNFYKSFIYSHESGCNTASVNSLGCAGIGQACPGSKLPCSLSDFACQDAYFSSYAVSRYGGWAQAYNYWLSHSYW